MDTNFLEEQTKNAIQKLNLTPQEASWLVFTGQAISSTYNFKTEPIYILFKDGTVKNIAEVDNALINEKLTAEVKKYYICYVK